MDPFLKAGGRNGLLLYQAAGLAGMISLDEVLRPAWLIGATVYEGCDRVGYYETADFADPGGLTAAPSALYREESNSTATAPRPRSPRAPPDCSGRELRKCEV